MWFLWFWGISTLFFLITFAIFTASMWIDIKDKYEVIKKQKKIFNSIRNYLQVFILAIIPIFNLLMGFVYIFVGENTKSQMINKMITNGTIILKDKSTL
jgi:phosphoribosylaminoimidazole (AIR) synthetase